MFPSLFWILYSLQPKLELYCLDDLSRKKDHVLVSDLYIVYGYGNFPALTHAHTPIYSFSLLVRGKEGEKEGIKRI